MSYTFKDYGSYASLAKYNEPYPKGYVQLPIKYGQSVIPEFGTFGYSSLTKGVVIPYNHPSLSQAYGKNAGNCGFNFN